MKYIARWTDVYEKLLHMPEGGVRKWQHLPHLNQNTIHNGLGVSPRPG